MVGAGSIRTAGRNRKDVLMTEQKDEAKVEDKTKEEQFKERPQDFEDIKDVLLIVKRIDSNIAIMNNCRTHADCSIVKGAIDFELTNRNAQLIVMAQKNQKIIKPKGGMMQFARNLRK